MPDPISTLAEAIRQKQFAVLATVVEVKGASPAKVGAQIVLRADGTIIGTVGGGKLEAAILADAQAALADGQPRLTHYRLTEEGPDAVACYAVEKCTRSSSPIIRRLNWSSSAEDISASR
jgi:xanthine/CO dehydrogenase XdhC/CoxF family maturation factor